jgi:hypothetical protein
MRFIWRVVTVSLFHSTTYAFVAGQIGPGIIELRSEANGGLQVQSFVVQDRGPKTWLYFCVVDKGPRKKQRCFYARQNKFPSLRAGNILDRIEYGLGPRIHNKHGSIAIGQQRYFYPVRSVGARAP